MPGEPGGSALEVFYSCAPQDEALRNRLLDHLKPLERQGLFTSWPQELLAAGDEVVQEVAQHLNRARIILLLLSSDYLASDECAAQMTRALERKRAGEAQVLAILLRPVDLDLLPFRSLDVLPSGHKPVTAWPAPHDESLQEVVRGIRRVLEQESAQPTLVASARTQVWNIPYGRNPLFTGRVGGIGKTQIALEYAYRYRETYRYVLWVNAANAEDLTTTMLELAALLQIPEHQEQAHTVAAVTSWFATHDSWLVIFDNADDLALVEDVLPTGGQGHLLLTRRRQVPEVLAKSIEVEHLGEEDGVLLLLRRAGVLAPDASLDDALAPDRAAAQAIVREMGGLPLALDQAGAYIEETRCSTASYLKRCQERQATVLRRRGGTGRAHPEPAAITWSLSFGRLVALDPLAADLLRVCALLAPDAIPESLVLEGASQLGERLQILDEDAGLLDEAVGTLLRFSLVKRKRNEATLSVHRLVQTVLRTSMDFDTRRTWAERVVRAVHQAFPQVTDYRNWPRCQQCLSHADACARLIDRYGFAFPEAARLCNTVGYYLDDRAQYTEAEAYYQRAIAIGEKALGTEHPDLATYCNNLALLYADRGMNADAEPLLQRALTILEKKFGPQHPFTFQVRENLLALQRRQNP